MTNVEIAVQIVMSSGQMRAQKGVASKVAKDSLYYIGIIWIIGWSESTHACTQGHHLPFCFAFSYNCSEQRKVLRS